MFTNDDIDKEIFFTKMWKQYIKVEDLADKCITEKYYSSLPYNLRKKHSIFSLKMMHFAIYHRWYTHDDIVKLFGHSRCFYKKYLHNDCVACRYRELADNGRKTSRYRVPRLSKKSSLY